MTVRIPRTGQIRLSGHISASFNRNSGSQTSMNNNGCAAAMHKTNTWSPTQRSMNDAHGVITAITLNDRYTNTAYGTNAYNWAADLGTYTTQSIFNKADCRSDGDIWSNSSHQAPSITTEGTHGQDMRMRMYGDNPGALYVNQYKKVNHLYTGETVPFKVEMATNSNEFGWGCSGQVYLYNYDGGYVLGNRSDNIGLQGIYGGSSNWYGSWTEANSPTPSGGIYMQYNHIVLGYRGFTQYPGYNSRIGNLTIRPYYMRLTATSGYA